MDENKSSTWKNADKRDISEIESLLLKHAHADQALKLSYNSQNDTNVIKPETLSHELRRLYGATGEDKLLLLASKPPISRYLLAPLPDDTDGVKEANPKLIDEILRDRQTEHENRKEYYSQQLRELNEEKKRIIHAQSKFQKDGAQQRDPSAPFSQVSDIPPDWTFTFKTSPPRPAPPVSATSAHSVASVIQDVRRNYPKERERYYWMRKKHEQEVKRLEKLNAPYRGELGIHTYKKSQLETQKMVRQLVEDEIDRFLDNLFKATVQAYSRKVQEALIIADKKETDQYRRGLVYENLSQLLSEQILFDVTRQITVEAVKEFFYICAISTNIADKILMNMSENIATGCEDGRDQEDPMYSTVTKLYFGAQEDRKENRQDIWQHTQYVHLIGRGAEEQIEPDELGVEYIEFNEIQPTELKSTDPHPLDSETERTNKELQRRYVSYEVKYWQNITAKLFTIPVHKQCRGICSTRMSHNHKFLAVGTYHGDILVYDLRVFPWKAVRAVYNINSKVEDPVVDISWSSDGSQLMTINILGTLNLWSFNAGSVSKDDLKGLGLGQADVAGFYTPQLIRQLEMDVDDNDFMYASGPLEMMGVHDNKYGPVTATFHPSITMFGTQRSLCVALENGDILKCDVESRLYNDTGTFREPARVYQPNVRPGIPSYLGSNVEAELFRQHNHPVIFVGFVDHLMDMITVDSHGYVNVWKYNKSNVTEYNWFKPWKRLRIRQYKIMYTPVGSAKPNVVFSDHLNRRVTRQQLARERKKAEETFAETKLQHSWHSEVIKEQRVHTRIYKPEGFVPEAGALFHIVSRHLGTDQMSMYMTRLYQPVKVAYARFYGVKQSPTGRELIILKLYPAHSPKRAHFTVLRFDLDALKMVDYRKDLFISEEEFDYYLRNEVIHWDISKVYGSTGSDYLFLNRNGELEAFSLNNGTKILKVIDPKSKPPDPFKGCRINNKTLKLTATSRVVCAGTRGALYIGFYEKLQDSLRVLQLQDKNTDVERRTMWKVFSSIPNHRHVPKEQRVNLEDFYLEDLQHPRVYARNIILETMDTALDKKRIFGAGVSDDDIALDQIVNYLSLRDHVPQLVSAAGRASTGRRGDDLLAPSSAPPTADRRVSFLDSDDEGEDGDERRDSLFPDQDQRRRTLPSEQRPASLGRDQQRQEQPRGSQERRPSVNQAAVNQPARNRSRPASQAVDGQRRPSGAQPEKRPSGGQPEKRPSGGQPEKRPSGGQPEKRPSAGQPEKRPSAGQPEKRPSAGQPEKRPSAGQPEKRPSGGQPEKRPSGKAEENKGAAGAGGSGTSKTGGAAGGGGGGSQTNNQAGNGQK